MLASRMGRVSMSPTTALNARVAQLKAEGKDVVKLNIGEPDASTFDYIKVAGIKAIADGFTKYTVGSGIPELRKAISEKLQKENNLTYPINQITVTVGGKQAVFASIMSLVEEGDEVLLPIPCWVSYTDMIKLAGGTLFLSIPMRKRGIPSISPPLKRPLLPVQRRLSSVLPTTQLAPSTLRKVFKHWVSWPVSMISISLPTKFMKS